MIVLHFLIFYLRWIPTLDLNEKPVQDTVSLHFVCLALKVLLYSMDTVTYTLVCMNTKITIFKLHLCSLDCLMWFWPWTLDKQPVCLGFCVWVGCYLSSFWYGMRFWPFDKLVLLCKLTTPGYNGDDGSLLICIELTEYVGPKYIGSGCKGGMVGCLITTIIVLKYNVLSDVDLTDLLWWSFLNL